MMMVVQWSGTVSGPGQLGMGKEEAEDKIFPMIPCDLHHSFRRNNIKLHNIIWSLTDKGTQQDKTT